jgi:hypothetical protein
LGKNLRVRTLHHQTGADDGGGGTTWFRKESSVPTSSGLLFDFPAEKDQNSPDLVADTVWSDLPAVAPSAQDKA